MRETKPVAPRQIEDRGLVSTSRRSGYARVRAPRRRRPILEWLGDRTLPRRSPLAVADLDTMAGSTPSTPTITRPHRRRQASTKDASSGRPSPAGCPPGRSSRPTSTATASPTWSWPTAAATTCWSTSGWATASSVPPSTAASASSPARNPVGITAADVNGDGRPDLVVANQGSDDVSVLLNVAARRQLHIHPGATAPGRRRAGRHGRPGRQRRRQARHPGQQQPLRHVTCCPASAGASLTTRTQSPSRWAA